MDGFKKVTRREFVKFINTYPNKDKLVTDICRICEPEQFRYYDGSTLVAYCFDNYETGEQIGETSPNGTKIFKSVKTDTEYYVKEQPHRLLLLLYFLLFIIVGSFLLHLVRCHL